ncbi:unnamed protein product [Bursaphelenchus okinawaensis]|uniref:Uncharacterized protein n=1 Tax=Bursaphelenchus okinawaensis TaxID=465554 RepID=A0A811LMV0_9BILA|nr:unnamed protein product [Bursaphelenchus okinawaensis]CAG9126629.1 unnamed protein product [Bursaphelenchus okinawaensis]
MSGTSNTSFNEYDQQFTIQDQNKIKKAVSQAVKTYLKADQTDARLKIKLDFANADYVDNQMVSYRPPIVDLLIDQVENKQTKKNTNEPSLRSETDSASSYHTERSSAGTDTSFRVVASTYGFRKSRNAQPPREVENKATRVEKWLNNNEPPKKISKEVKPFSNRSQRVIREKKATESEYSDATLKYVDSMTTVDYESSCDSEYKGPMGCVSEEFEKDKAIKRVQVGGGLAMYM